MSVDVVVAVPAFLDMTFVGLEALPGLGEERFAGDLVRSPGGGAITAIGAARLGLTVAAAPAGRARAAPAARRRRTGGAGGGGEKGGGRGGAGGVKIVGTPCTRTPV